MDDVAWWRENLEEPCLLVLARATQLNAMVDGDAPVELSSQPTSLSENPAKRQKQDQTPPQRSHNRGLKHHNVTADGSEYTTNRQNLKLCEAFQNGTCSQTQAYWCPHKEYAVHQCSKCLSTEHGSKHPKVCSLSPKSISKGSGKSSGKVGESGKRKGAW